MWMFDDKLIRALKTLSCCKTRFFTLLLCRYVTCIFGKDKRTRKEGVDVLFHKYYYAVWQYVTTVCRAVLDKRQWRIYNKSNVGCSAAQQTYCRA